MRVVIDTNVLIDGVRDEMSPMYRIIEKCIEGKITPLMSSRIKREYTGKASQLISDEGYFDVLEDFYDSAEEVWVTTRVRESVDRQDNKFLEAAVDGEAAYVISSDADLTDLSEVRGVRIVTPAEFWNIYSDETGEESNEFASWVQGMMGRSS
ncbi:MAG: putative toxin-antitoxin system toxin component, PIN family [Candidatus Kerfeldbacteria bacterium]|nr:putative toxin-antitoxin system toxin component, PIN family [Candidatus Kerfeldbacteria bacterium]